MANINLKSLNFGVNSIFSQKRLLAKKKYGFYLLIIKISI